jgi:hypothetical protein
MKANRVGIILSLLSVSLTYAQVAPEYKIVPGFCSTAISYEKE